MNTELHWINQWLLNAGFNYNITITTYLFVYPFDMEDLFGLWVMFSGIQWRNHKVWFCHAIFRFLAGERVSILRQPFGTWVQLTEIIYAWLYFLCTTNIIPVIFCLTILLQYSTNVLRPEMRLPQRLAEMANYNSNTETQ